MVKTSILLLALGAIGTALPRNNNHNNHSWSPPTPSTECTPQTMSVRKDWSSLTLPERLSFISAIQCLMTLPPQTPSSIAPGARSRYDDFVAAHISQVFATHSNGVFLAWHRHFLYLFEQALKNECGYTAALPYWNWPLYTDDLYASALFDGSETSLGSDGAFDPNAPGAPPNGNYVPPAGRGGGCIERGPFSDRTSSFRYFKLEEIFNPNRTVPADALEYAPHCLKRNLIPEALKGSNSQAAMERLLSEPSIEEFQARYESIQFLGPSDGPDYGIHGGGHVAVGGDHFDQFVAPSDPIFYLHHATIDRIYIDWQNVDPKNRQYALNGTNVYGNPAGAEEVTLDYVQDFFGLGEPMKIRDLMDVTKGPYCYRYEH